MTTKDDEKDNVYNLTVEILKDIRTELRGVNVRIVDLEKATIDEFRRLRGEMRDGFEHMSRRLEHLRDFSGERYREMELRLGVLEERMSRIDPKGQ